jgi:two-component system cell cycle sensor histidine kinase/response regulator CckA
MKRPEPVGSGRGRRHKVVSPAIIFLSAIALAFVAGSAALAIMGLVPGRLGDIIVWITAVAGLLFAVLATWRAAAKMAGSPAAIFADLADASSRPHLTTDSQGQTLYSNSATQALLTALDVAGSGGAIPTLSVIETFVEEESAKLTFSRLRANAIVGISDHADIPLISRNGIRWFNFSTSPVRDGLALWVAEDVTERRELASVRREEETTTADFLDFLPVGFFSADGEGEMRYVNSTLSEWLGITQLEIGTKPRRFAEFIVEEDGFSAVDPAGMHGWITLRGAEGEKFPAFLVQSERENADGEFQYSRSVVLRAPFAPAGGIKETEIFERFPWLYRDAPVGIVRLDLHGNVTDCNRAFLKLLGLHRDAILGRALSERITKEDGGDFAAQLSKVVMGTMPATMLDVRMPSGGQSELMASIYVSRMVDAADEVSGLVLHVIDTTEQKNLEVQFAQSQKMQAVGQLAGGVAHDFNNLLTAMIGFCDLLLGRHGPDDPSFADIMQIKQNANRAANLVRQLLAFSRRQTLRPKVLDVTQALSDLSNLLRRLIGENIELVMEHGQGIGPVRADPGQFDQVIINLVVNARDAMPRGGQITIDTEHVVVGQAVQRGHEVMPAGSYVLIKAVDTGAGIPKENIGHIFEPFFSTKEVGEGTGLGLSTVYGIVRQSEGYIFVDSAPGEGTTFSIYLPEIPSTDVAARRLDAAATQNIVAETDLTGGGTVLLVEDEDAVRVFGSRALRNKGYRVLEANDGEDALDVINGEGTGIDLIITDVVMPGMDGHTLVRLIREEIPGIKVILMSGYAEDAIPGGIGQDASVHFLPKPFSLQDLAGKVKEVMAD